MENKQSQVLFEDAQNVLVGGVNSPVRAFKAVGSYPIFMKKGDGAYVYSEDNQRYIDYVLSYGPLLLGHCDSDVLNSIKKAAEFGTTFGAPTANETELAKLVMDFYPSIDKLRLVSSGTEATMIAIRLARGYTGKKRIIKFNGCYHGHSDNLLVASGSGALTLGKPSSDGIPEETTQFTHVLEFNDIESIKTVFDTYSDEIACVIMEPVCGNMGVITPKPGYLETIREYCDKYNSVLIFDEVMCGFRVAPGGAQELFNIKADITCLGKVIGGGLPCGAYGGKKEIMDWVSPIGSVYQAGTLSGNPVVVQTGLTTLKKIKNEKSTERAIQLTNYLVTALREALKNNNMPYTVNQCGSMFSLFLTDKNVSSLDDVNTCDIEKFKTYYQQCLSNGIYFAPSQYEANFMSSVHSENDIEHTIQSIINALK